MVTERELMFYRLYRHYQGQLLFSSGGVSDQYNLYLEAMEVIEARVKHIEVENASRQ